MPDKMPDRNNLKDKGISLILGSLVSVFGQLALLFPGCGEAEHHSSLEIIAEQAVDLKMARNETTEGQRHNSSFKGTPQGSAPTHRHRIPAFAF